MLLAPVSDAAMIDNALPENPCTGAAAAHAFEIFVAGCLLWLLVSSRQHDPQTLLIRLPQGRDIRYKLFHASNRKSQSFAFAQMSIQVPKKIYTHVLTTLFGRL